MKRQLLYPVYFLSFLLITTSCSIQTNPVTGKSRLLAYSWSQEIEIGREVDKEIVNEFGLYDDDAISEYVYSIGNDLLEVSHMRRPDTDREFRETEFFFKVLDSPVVNAFALPGGYTYVTRGLMAHLNNEAQLAMVMGHEIGHVAARHASQRTLQQTFGQVLVIGGAVLGQELFGLPGESILNVSSMGAQLLFLSYGRDAERESDRLGVEYSAMVGYAAEEGAEFFTSLKRITERHGAAIPNMLSSHPNPGEREQNIPKMANEWREQGYEMTRKNTELYMGMLNGMTFGENPREGYVDDGEFLHPDLEFKFPVPAGWQVINQRQQVVLVGPNQNAVMIFRIDGQSDSAQQSVQSFIGQDGITVNEGPEQVLSSGQFNGYRADVTVQQQEGNLRVIVHAIEFDGRVYRFINYTGVNRFEEFEDALTTVPFDFDRVTDETVLNIQPVTLHVFQAENSGTFRDFLPDELPMGIDEEEVAIINQVYLDDYIEAGRYLKIPVQ